MVIAYEGAEDDKDLLDRITRRDPEGLSSLYDRYSGLAFSLAYHLVRERGTAEDVVQASFLAIWRHAATYDTTRGAVRPWLLTIVHHQATSVLRARQARGGAMLDIAQSRPLPATVTRR